MPSAPDRLRSFLSCKTAACDQYGVIRAEVMRRVSPLESYHHADVIMVARLLLHGPFYQVPDWLTFRRDYPERAYLAYPKVRIRCVNHDPRRANPLKHPAARLLAEYIWGYVTAIRDAPLSPADRRECYGHLARWMVDWAVNRARPGRPEASRRAAGPRSRPSSGLRPRGRGWPGGEVLVISLKKADRGPGRRRRAQGGPVRPAGRRQHR